MHRGRGGSPLTNGPVAGTEGRTSCVFFFWGGRPAWWNSIWCYQLKNASKKPHVFFSSKHAHDQHLQQVGLVNTNDVLHGSHEWDNWGIDPTDFSITKWWLFTWSQFSFSIAGNLVKKWYSRYNVCKLVHRYIYTCMHACMHACMHTYIHTSIHAYCKWIGPSQH